MGSGAAELILLVLAATFHQDVAPLLQRHCQTCHRSGGIAPMPLVTYAETRPWAKAIRGEVVRRTMPPWFADRRHGVFANDPSLTEAEIATIRQWVDEGAPAGQDVPRDAGSQAEWTIPEPDLVVEMPRAFAIPRDGEVDYQYVILPLGLKQDRWVTAAEAVPGAREAVHHIVLYVREPQSTWLRDVPAGVVWSPKDSTLDEKRRIGHTTSDILLVYAPGSPAMALPRGMAKKVRAGSDVILQIHYTPAGKALQDRTKVGVVFAKAPPESEVLTLQMGTDRIRIPPGEPDYRLTVSGTLPNEARLLSFFPHMHLRGKSFEYRLVGPGGYYETLLKVPDYDFAWQMQYRLAEPRRLSAGVRLQMEAHYDNSANNPRNPDPEAEVTWGEQSREEMMIGFFDIAVAPGTSKAGFFERKD